LLHTQSFIRNLVAGKLSEKSIAGAARATALAHPHLTTTVALRQQLTADYPHLANEDGRAVLTACRRAMSNRCEASNSGEVPLEPAALKVTTEGQGRTIESLASTTVRTLDGLLQASQTDPLLWEVTRHEINKWDVSMNTADGPAVATNWQVKAWLSPIERVNEYTVAEMAKVLAPLVRRTGHAFRPKQTEAHADYLLELDIFDLHLGKRADVLETGEHYDLQAACELYDTAVDKLLARAAGYPIGTVLLPVGNDFFNSDSLLGATTKGTPQHEDARWQRTFVTGSSLIIGAVNRLREKGLKVKIVTVPGNHDYQNTFFLGQVLQATFSECPDVEIDCTFPPRKYVQFHDCAIMFTHGSDEKESNLAMLFAQEQPLIWAATKFREAHLAHVHHKKEFKYRTMAENIGLTVRYMRSLSATDAWHFAKGYVGSHRSAEAFVWARGEGVVAHLTYTYSPVNHLTRQAA
jgi:hypothetical protein